MKTRPLDRAFIEQFVRAAHGNFSELQRLAKQNRAVLTASTHWGGGDWENALQAAAHTGNRTIAKWLIAQGVPIDLFAAAMLGDVTIVRAIVERYPHLLYAKGAHDIPLLHHALVGGHEARDVYDYLTMKMTKERWKV